MTALVELNLSEQQCVWALHRDTSNLHVHISVNRVDLHARGQREAR